MMEEDNKKRNIFTKTKKKDKSNITNKKDAGKNKC